MARKIIGGTRDVAIRSPASLYLGHGYAHDVDLPRINRVIAKIVRGIYYREFHKPVPAAMEVAGYIDPPMDALDPPTIKALLNRTPTTIGGTAFQYWHGTVDDRPDLAVFLLRFYQGHFALGFVMPEGNG